MSRFEIKSVRLLNFWSYNTNCEDCMICHENLCNPSLYNNDMKYSNSVAFGACGHIFHSICIHNWLSNNKNCPTCITKFIIVKTM